MVVIVWTLGFLMLFSTATYFRIENFQMTDARFKVYLGKKDAIRDANLMAQRMAVEVHKETRGENKSEGEKRPRSTPNKKLLYLEFPEFNAKLNLKKVFNEYSQGIQQMEKDGYYQVFIRLLDGLYGDHLFFNQNKNTSHRLAEALMEKITFKPDPHKIELKSTLDLASVDLKDVELQEVWYEVLKGTESRKDDRSKGAYPSLLEFVTIEEHHKKGIINIHFASVELLTALFKCEKAALEIIARREYLHKQGERHTKSKKAFLVTEDFLKEEDVRAILEEHHLHWEHYKSWLDLGVRRPDKDTLSSGFLATGEGKKGTFLAKQKIPKLPKNL
ncbi:MAG: hypothetical protein P4L16_03425 [Chlamydiales bacterium]|nr:hypothetical protein [Chlamydiales bacterium]